LRRVRSLTLAVALALPFGLGVLGPTPARADDLPTSAATEYSPLERRVIARAVDVHHGEIDSAPEGKVIESVEYERLDVFGPDDPIPDQLNVFHSVTRERILARELLVGPGERWHQVLVDETSRNLRKLPQISMALTVPMRGSGPGKVKLLVITRDVWSLRLQWDVQFVGGHFNYLLLQPTEANLAGQAIQPQFIAEYQPLSWRLGTGVTVPRFGTSHVGATVSGGLMLPNGTAPGRTSKGAEGAYAAFDVSQPVYSSLAPWAWDVAGSYQNSVYRRYQDGALKQYAATLADGTTENVPIQFRQRVASAVAAATRSLGWALKNDFTIGFMATARRYSVEGEVASAAAIDRFVHSTAVPIGETRVYPFARWRSYRTDYFRTTDVESLDVQEDYRLGHDVYLEVDPISRALGSTRSLVAVSGGASWTSRLGDGLVRGTIEGAVETQTDGTTTDAWLDAKLGIVTPRTRFGRVAFSGRVIHRPENYLQRSTYLGGDGRLRGYPSSFVFGPDLVAMNLEYRTPGFDLVGMSLGGALFYDAGEAYPNPKKLGVLHSVGAGLRFLFPFFDQVAYRLDFAVPLNRSALPRGSRGYDVIFGVEQAFAFPGLCGNARGLQAPRQCP
jgi:hypothetical protein